MTSYFKFGDITIKVPEKMIVDDKQGNPLLKDTLTKSGNLSTYLGHKSIQIKDVANLNRVKIVTDYDAHIEYVKPETKKRGRKPKPTPTPELTPELTPREIFNKKYLPYIQKLNDEGNKFDKGIPYAGKNSLDFLIYLYFSKKYNLKHCFNELLDRSYYSIFINNPVTSLSHKTVMKRMLECISEIQNIEQDIVFMPLSISYKEGGSHANFFMYKKSTSEIIHQDPHGTIKEKTFFIEFVNQLNIMNFLENKKYYTTRLKLVESEELCPIGLQALENRTDNKIYKNEGGGWCMMWSYLTFELIAMGEDIKYSVIVDLIIELQKKTSWTSGEPRILKYIDIIRGYINHIYNELKPLIKEIFDVTITTNKEMYDFYKNKINQKRYNKIIDKIVNRPFEYARSFY